MWAGSSQSADPAGSGPQAEALIKDAPAPLPPALIDGESTFYGSYRWCLDACPTVADVRVRLRGELSGLREVEGDWRRDEALQNVFLLSCALADSVDDHLSGDRYDLSQAAALVPALDYVARAVDRLVAGARRLRAARLRALAKWREAWGAAIHDFLRASLAVPRAEPEALAAAVERLGALLEARLGGRLLARRTKVPAAFRSQDLTHHDVLELTARFAAAFPDRQRPLLIVGLRTAGSYFAPLVRAALAVLGYQDLEAVTLRPKKGVAPWEQAPLLRCAARRGLALLVDEPPDTGTTLARVVGVLRGAGVPARDVVALLPIHPTRRDWRSGHDSLPLADVRVLPLEPQEWHKQRLLAPELVERRLRPYFRARGYAAASVVVSPAADRFNRHLRFLSEEKYHSRLKRVYEVRLQAGNGLEERRYVLAKSVGWGWLGYHAFLASQCLGEFVPPVLGLRDGILYTEWLPQSGEPAPDQDRETLPGRLASYVAARVRGLALASDPGPRLDRLNQKGTDVLAAALSGAYGWKPAAVLQRSQLHARLARRSCPVPTLIDGKMRAEEWVRGPSALLKTDYEHHGMGKTELNVSDPAYDLAAAIFHFQLSETEERALLDRYLEESGDHGVLDRLFFAKLLAGTTARIAALDNLRDPRLRPRHPEFNRSYIEAWEFLTTQAARFCGARCRPATPGGWRVPLLVMDVDGVLDKQIFGFPTTTAAGIEALRLLHGHGVALCLNTARTLEDVQEYCRAYGLLGGVAEYGGVAWDAVSGRTRVLVTPDSRDELDRLAEALRRLPGVFLNDHYRHSLRVYTYERGRTVPLPMALVQGLVSDLRLTRLAVHQTYLDTTVLAAETDKGKGLLALLELAGVPGLEAMAIGDSEPDLAMFRVAARSYAPSHMSGRGIARLMGCKIAPRSYQGGLLSAARSIVHADGGTCPRCADDRPRPAGLWWELLEAADRHPLALLAGAMADPRNLAAFRR